MRNPTYADDFKPYPLSETSVWMDVSKTVPKEELPTLAVGMKTITHDRLGRKLCPHRVVVLEVYAGKEMASLDFDAYTARRYAARLSEYADMIEAGAVQ